MKDKKKKKKKSAVKKHLKEDIKMFKKEAIEDKMLLNKIKNSY
jgi:hypothetical protein